MSTRARAAVLDGHSIEADGSIASADLQRVQLAVIEILKAGAKTHDDIEVAYSAMAGSDPAVPHVTPQRIRTATSDLHHLGRVVPLPEPGKSRHGRKATRWGLTLKETA